jgi:arsenate reductase
MNGLLAYLTENCCAGKETCCPDITCKETPLNNFSKENTVSILFLCTGNSCRSILCEATFNHLAPTGWKAMSAGSKPAGYVHPRSLALLAREGISTEGYHSKSWENLPATPDIVISVCGNAANETCPAYLGPVTRSHWGVEDPAHATGTDEEIDTEFMKAYSILRARIEAFLALPLETLKHDKAALKLAMDKIATIVI